MKKSIKKLKFFYKRQGKFNKIRSNSKITLTNQKSKNRKLKSIIKVTPKINKLKNDKKIEKRKQLNTNIN